METKQKRTKVKVILSIILPALLIMGILAVSGHADKPDSPPGLSKPKPEPIEVSIMGAMEGTGNPANISIAFVDSSFGSSAGEFIANPDYPPALKVSGPGINRSLSYYYCDSTEPEHSTTDGICDDDEHDPDNYKNLRISNGKLEKKTDKVIFPAGSSWRITQKIVDPITGDVTGEVVAEGTLETEASYEVLVWSTP